MKIEFLDRRLRKALLETKDLKYRKKELKDLIKQVMG